MKICFICGEYPPSPHGGIGSVLRTLCTGFVRHGHRVRVVGIRERGDTAPEQEIVDGVEVLRMPLPRVRYLGWLGCRYRLYREVAAWARRGEVDLVEAPDYEGWTAGWRPLPIPVVARLHGSVSYFNWEGSSPINRLTFELERRALKRATFHCSTSRYTADLTRELFGLEHFEPKILYNPVAYPENGNIERPAGFQVVFTGTLTAKKGVIPLIHAWSDVVRAFPKAELHLYGRDGKSPDRRSMREYLVAQLPDSARASVTFHGHVPYETVVEALASANVGVFPSFSEACGVAPLESMAQGCPTIYSLRASGPELVIDGKDCLLVDPANEKDIAKAIIRLLGNPDLARRISAEGRKRVKDAFSVDAAVMKNIAFYQDCVKQYGAL